MVGIMHNKCPKEKEIYANWMKKSNDMKQNKDFNKLCYNICGSNQKIDNSDGYPKCVPKSKASKMSASQKKSAVQRKRAKPQGVGGKPTNVKTLAKKRK